MSNNQPLYTELKEYITDYINLVETINERRLKAAEREMQYLVQESRAFNILRQNMSRMEENGISEDQ